ncbi:hypothetical protein JV46_25420 [Solemya velum gill symbiont]|uniref:Uncharacterized protein n=1 Tax=Solemya velum gill symbiont TaxID=2340 RepID=A0A0B0H5X8_SOVGS|nr:hypothetical protein JV46_25420 [Solemya velum gill symbiont]
MIVWDLVLSALGLKRSISLIGTFPVPKVCFRPEAEIHERNYPTTWWYFHCKRRTIDAKYGVDERVMVHRILRLDTKNKGIAKGGGPSAIKQGYPRSLRAATMSPCAIPRMPLGLTGQRGFGRANMFSGLQCGFAIYQ